MKKLNIGVIVVAGLLTTGLIATVSRGSRQDYIDSETQALLDLKAQNPTDEASLEMLRGLPNLQERDKAINEGQDAPRAEKERLIAEKKRSLEENLRQIEAREKETLSNPPPLTAPQVAWAEAGIYDPYQVNFENIDAKEYKMLNFWTSGWQDNDIQIYSGGYKKDNPLQGVVEVNAVSDIHDVTFYPAPTATGPLKVLSEKDGILTLISVAGEYEKESPTGELATKVEASGGARYLFDTKALRFIDQ